MIPTAARIGHDQIGIAGHDLGITGHTLLGMGGHDGSEYAAARHPRVRAAILMQHHPWPGRALPLLPVLASARRLRDQPVVLESALDPAMAATAPVTPVPGVEVLRAPALVPALVPLAPHHHLIDRRAPVRHMGPASIKLTTSDSS